MGARSVYICWKAQQEPSSWGKTECQRRAALNNGLHDEASEPMASTVETGSSRACAAFRTIRH